MDRLWKKKFSHLGEIIRYADDFVIICKTKQQALESIRAIQAIMGKLDLTINPDKSRLVNLWNDIDGFDFLDFHNRKLPIRRNHGQLIYVMTHFPKRNAMKKMRAKIKAFTEPRSKLYLDLRVLVKGLNRRLQGFKDYYSISPAAKKWLNRIDSYVLERLTLFNNKKRNRRKQHWFKKEVKDEVKHILVKLAS